MHFMNCFISNSVIFFFLTVSISIRKKFKKTIHNVIVCQGRLKGYLARKRFTKAVKAVVLIPKNGKRTFRKEEI